MKIIFIVVSLLLLFPFQSDSFAEVKTYIREYSYSASEADSKLSSRTTAMREVKRLLLEELGTYLESITEVKNFKLTQDQITALTAGIVKTEVIDEKWNGSTYWIKTKIVADTSDTIKSIDKLRQDRNKLKELEDTKKRSNALLAENKELRNERALAKGSTKQNIQQRYDKSIKELSAIEWYERGYNNYLNGYYERAISDYSNSISGFDKAIELYKKSEIISLRRIIDNSNNIAGAYYNRARAYSMIGNTKKAIQDLNKALQRQIGHDLTDVAKTDNDFNNIRNTSEFKKLVYK